MLKALLLYLSKAAWARRIVTGWGIARKTATRFVAGETLDQALTAVRSLNERGLLATLDHLGEHVSSPDEARRAADDYLELIERICDSGVRSNASLKLTQLGLAVDAGLCRDNMRRILAKAEACGMMVRIDMEDSPTVDRTLELHRALRAKGLANSGLVFQSYLFRTEDDVRAVLAEGTRIRLCKGAYREPPEVAYPRKADVDAAYDRVARQMIDASLGAGASPGSQDGRWPPVVALATHDAKRIQAAQEYARQVGLPREALEFQMLYGIRPDLQAELAAQGYPVRVYVAYGTSWYPFFMRRLAERPANLWFFAVNFFRS